MKTPKERISKARFDFLLDHPFLGELSLRLCVVEDKKLLTMATDMRRLIYNPEFVGKCTPEHLLGTIAHEIAHCIFRHPGKENVAKSAGKNQDVWRVACEYMVNHFVIDLVGLTLPPGVYYNKKYGTGEWTTESIYFDILKDYPDVGKAVASGEMADDHSAWGDGNGQTLEGSEGAGSDSDWKVWVAQAAHNAKRRGKLPAGLQRLVDETLESKLNWRQVIAEFVINKSKDDYSWRRPNKRHVWRGIYAPSLQSDSINIAFAMDTSGSMGADEHAEGLSELKGICGAFPSFRLWLFASDAAIHHEQEVTPSDEIDIQGLMKGGGGTSFIPVFDRLKDQDIKIDALVYFTDACGDFPDEAPDYPVLWVVKGNAEVPWGRRVDYD